MRFLIAAALLAGALLAAGTAQAYAIYNHMDQFCGIWHHTWHDAPVGIARPHHHFNGSHGSGLKHAHVECCNLCKNIKNKSVWVSDTFDIPKGGYARIYPNYVIVYKHDGTEVASPGMDHSSFSWDNDCRNELATDPNYWCR